ncbi:MAG: hypothetical protein PHZ25_01400 [Candidatus Pacebacteria bacterium]|nr:hypothetical protein [Candidatus Paceibacterota bacterium]
MTEGNLIYIFGLLENSQDYFFNKLKKYAEFIGFHCEGIELYESSNFGSYSLNEEIERIRQKVISLQPVIIIGHSLGGYIALQLSKTYPLILLDSSLAISDIILSNLKQNNKTY